MKKRLYLPCLVLFMMINVMFTSMWAAEPKAGTVQASTLKRGDIPCLLRHACTPQQKHRILMSLADLPGDLRKDIQRLIDFYGKPGLGSQERERIEVRLRAAGLFE